MRRALIEGPNLESAAPLVMPLLLLVAMHWSAQFLAIQSSRLFGRRIHLYFFGLLGTIVHEGSHVVACVLFRHRVHRIKWFDPQATAGALGSVEHSYDPASAYQRVGTIAIGIAPLVVGAAVILWSAQRLLGISLADVDLSNVSASAALSRAMSNAFEAPFWKWALFAYVSISVGGSMHLSASDVRGTWRGVVTLAVFSVAALLVTTLVWWVLQQTAPRVWDADVVPPFRVIVQWFIRTSESLSIAMLLALAINALCALLLMLPARAR
ncbi:hypothetical protein [Gemmatimonas sp.]|uniref:hypothetical protein n=1 Tax=Gemmatimonas sp. TaxID=1962908 RepID=UPI0039834147